MKSIKKFFPIIFIIVLALFSWVSDLHNYLSFESFKEHQKNIEKMIEGNVIFSCLGYSFLYIMTVALSIPGATFMTLIGGILFGQWVGSVLVICSATIGATLLFLSARMASGDLVAKKAGSFIKKMQSGFQQNALSYLLTIRLIPLFPFVAVNLAAAFFQMSLKSFVLGTFFGIMPGSFVYVSMGVALHEVIQKENFSFSAVLEPEVIVALSGLAVLSLLPVFYKKIRQKK